MGLDEETTESIYYAAPMHDVGKIGIPDAILLKPGTLSPGEWEIMKTHTTIGGQILQGSSLDIIRMAETIALTHHEKWDGSGYPRGLQGEDIPLIGRISAIADVFDALTSKRPYKEVHTLDRAFAIIREGRGTHFDPQVVDAFFSALNEILYIQAFEQDAQMNAGLKQELRTIEWERPMAG
jgi:putative two-component system response regulator